MLLFRDFALRKKSLQSILFAYSLSAAKAHPYDAQRFASQPTPLDAPSSAH
jgi:hypothetical protein